MRRKTKAGSQKKQTHEVMLCEVGKSGRESPKIAESEASTRVIWGSDIPPCHLIF